MAINTISVALKKCPGYSLPEVTQAVGDCLDILKLELPARANVLVKPNLVTSKALACTHPHVTAAVCSWLLDHGHKPIVADSPAFGTAKKVAAFLGLDVVLAKMNVPLREMDRFIPLPIKLANGRHAIVKVGHCVLDADVIFSLPKLKAHSQMRMTLAVKNCFGCVPGPRKALLHTLNGATREEFANWLAALYLALPPVAAVCDGITAMSGTGPANGEAYELGLIAACASPQVLDLEILKIVNVPLEEVSLNNCLNKLQPQSANYLPQFPLNKPEDFAGGGFRTPAKLKPTSFSPAVLFRSMLRRWWAASRFSKKAHEAGNGENA